MLLQVQPFTLQQEEKNEAGGGKGPQSRTWWGTPLKQNLNNFAYLSQGGLWGKKKMALQSPFQR